MMNMEETLKRLKFHEGLNLMPYKCPAGFLTIGYGHNLITNPLTDEDKKVLGDWAKGITLNGAAYLLKKDVRRAYRECAAAFGFWKALDDERQYALVDMAFNLGMNRLLNFKKMIAALEIGDYQGAAKEVLNSKYAADVGKRAKRIARTIEKGEFCYD